jgi:hypothetical protein
MNALTKEKKTTAIAMLCEGSSIRSIERITGVHRDTVMRLGVRVGDACRKIMDEKMRDLPCQNLEVDEIWGYIGSKQKNAVRSGNHGDVWTFICIDTDTKLIPSHLVGKRDLYHARAFMDDVAGRMKNRVQLSSDRPEGLHRCDRKGVRRGCRLRPDFKNLFFHEPQQRCRQPLQSG